MTYFDTKTIGIIYPHCMTFKINGTLFIGTTPDTVSDKAKLFELEFSEIF